MGILIGGPTPTDGASAYDIAVANGFVGTETQWLASLVGPAGPAGPTGPVGSGIPKDTIMFGKYSASKFDANGLGKINTDVYGWAYADGRNNTLDMRGFVPGGGINYGAGALHPIVDPGAHNNETEYNNNVNSTGGEVKHVLTINELPAHNHTIQDPGHKHHLSVLKNKPSGGSNNGTYGDQNFNTQPNVDTDTNTTGISIDNTGGGKGHDNRQPTRYGVFIQKIV